MTENVLINFTVTARTSDHMFVLKSLIDNYTNIRAGMGRGWQIIYMFCRFSKSI